MATILTDETELHRFVASLAENRIRGLRVNTTKATEDEVLNLMGISADPIPWASAAHVVPASRLDLGRHPAHKAGLYYLQEPSAMAPVTALASQAGDVVADLTAAPGGKTTQLVDAVGPTGIVVANEINHTRRRALEANLDRWGAQNVLVTSQGVDVFAARFAQCFDGVLLDAPCSGEALFRRDNTARQQWSMRLVERSARLQGDLLQPAVEMMADATALVYSTCAFGISENEQQVDRLLRQYPHLHLNDLSTLAASWPGQGTDRVPAGSTARFWPHHHRAEGQFVARLSVPHRSDRLARSQDGGINAGQEVVDVRPWTPAPPPTKRKNSPRREHRTRGRKPQWAPTADQVIEQWLSFATQYVAAQPTQLYVRPESLVVRGDNIWMRPASWIDRMIPRAPDLAVIERTLSRPGLPLGRAKPGRFEPHHALAATLTAETAAQSLVLRDGDPNLTAYLEGLEIESAGPNGWVLVCYHRWGLGWGRRTNGRLKNFLPRHLREAPRKNNT